jgi:hypothetical protein
LNVKTSDVATLDDIELNEYQALQLTGSTTKLDTLSSWHSTHASLMSACCHRQDSKKQALLAFTTDIHTNIIESTWQIPTSSVARPRGGCRDSAKLSYSVAGSSLRVRHICGNISNGTSSVVGSAACPGGKRSYRQNSNAITDRAIDIAFFSLRRTLPGTSWDFSSTFLGIYCHKGESAACYTIQD